LTENIPSEAAVTLRGLPADLAKALSLLEGAPDGIASSTLALLPYGSRRLLAAAGLIGPVPQGLERAGEISITRLGRAVIAASAAQDWRH